MSIKQDVVVLAKQLTNSNSYITTSHQKEEVQKVAKSLMNIFDYIKSDSDEIKAKQSGDIKLDNKIKNAIKDRFITYLNSYEHDSLNELPNKEQLAVKLVYFQIICNTPHDKLIKCILQCGRDGKDVSELTSELDAIAKNFGYT